MKVSEAIHGLGRPVAYYPSLARIIGVRECIFICQFIYWIGKEKDRDGWIYKSRDEILEETGLTHESQFTARKNLRKIGLLEERTRRVEHKMYFRVNLNALDAVWQSRFPETVNHGFVEPGTTVSVITENTSESTNIEKAKESRKRSVSVSEEEKDRLMREVVQVPKNAPNDQELAEILSRFPSIQKIRGSSMFFALKGTKFHTWKKNRWVPILNLIKYLEKTDEKLARVERLNRNRVSVS